MLPTLAPRHAGISIRISCVKTVVIRVGCSGPPEHFFFLRMIYASRIMSTVQRWPTILVDFSIVRSLISAPEYLKDLIKVRCTTRYNLRSDGELLLEDNSARSKKTLGDRTFKVAAPRIWNILPKDIRKQDNYHIFKKQLKTYYFKLAYTNIGVYQFFTLFFTKFDETHHFFSYKYCKQ